MTGYLSLLILLGCPLMMIFMMRGGHGGHGGHGVSHGMGAEGDSREQRIATLEREVSRLRSEAHDRGNWQDSRR